MSKIRLIVDFENFELIKSGQKKEEYRAATDNYTRRFCDFDKKGEFVSFKKFDAIEFQKGYTKETCTVECINLELVEWMDKIPPGLKKGDVTYCIDLGNVLEAAS